MKNFKIDKDLCLWLKSTSIDYYEFGTSLENGGHDVDRVYIIPNYVELISAPVDSKNWLHYKGIDPELSKSSNVDYLFVTESAFYNAIINGLSHVPYECMRNGRRLTGYLEGDIDDYLFTYRALKSYRGLLRKDIKQARTFKINGSKEKYNKKVRFIIDSINLLSGYIDIGNLKIPNIDDEAFLTKCQIIHNHIQVEMNHMFERGELPEVYDGWIFEYRYWSSVVEIDDSEDLENIDNILSLLMEGV